MPLPRFFFHVRRGGRLATDEEGVEHPDDAAALDEAIQGARDVVATWVKAGDPVDPGEVVVVNEAGKVVAEVRFRDVVRLL
jgi:hypothetical protein